MTQDPVPLCEHLQALLPPAERPALAQDWGGWRQVVVGAEPDSALAARTGLHAEISHPTTSGFTYAWNCPVHGHSLGWGRLPPQDVPVSQDFLTAAHRRDKGAVPPPGEPEVSTSGTHVPQDLLEALGWRAAGRRRDLRQGLLIALGTVVAVLLLAAVLVATGLA